MTRTKSSRALLSVVLAVLMVAAFMPALTYSSFAATAKKATKVTKLNHTGAKVYGKVGNKYVLKYKLSPSKLTSAAKKTVWKSSDSSIVKVYSTKGKHAAVKVKGVGTAKITVYTKANTKAKAVWSFKTKKPAEAAAPTIDTSKVQTTYGLATQYNKVASSITKADLLKNVTAKDASGKDVTVSIASIKEVSSTGDSINAYDEISAVEVKNQAKHFEVTYTATDANGKTATKTVVVTVKNLDPEVTANNFSVAIQADNTKNTALTAKDLINKGITAVNDYESFPADTKAEAKTADAFQNAVKGNTIEVAKITDASGKSLETTDKSVTPAKTTADPSQIKTDRAGTYNITYKVTDFLGASVEKTVTLTVQNNTAPTIATTTANVYEGSKDNAADVRAQLTYNDAEDGNNVKVSSVAANKNVTVNFVDKYGTKVEESDPYFYDKVAGAWIVNVQDNDGAYAASKLITITAKKGLVLTAKDQVVELSTSAHKLDTADLMSYISATLNGQAYALDNPATVRNGNTTIKVTDANGKEATIFSDTTGTYNVTYTVTATVDGHEFAASKTIKVKVQDSAKESADEVAALIDKIKTATDKTAAAKAARTAYDKLTPAAQAKVTNYDYLVAVEKDLATAEQNAKDQAQAAGVDQKIDAVKDAKTTDEYAAKVEDAQNAYDSLTDAQKEKVTKKTDLENYTTILNNTKAAKITVTPTTDTNGTVTGATVEVKSSIEGALSYSWMAQTKDGKWVTLERDSASTTTLDAQGLKDAGYKQVKVAVSGSGVAGTLYSDPIDL